MKWEEIKELFKDEWVLIRIHRVDDEYQKEEIYRAVMELRPEKFSIDYTGEFPHDLPVVLPGVVRGDWRPDGIALG